MGNKDMTTSEKVAYLKGLVEGMKFDKKSDEGKLFNVIVDILTDMSNDIEDVAGDLYELSEDVDAISDDLSDVEDYLCGEEWDDEDETLEDEDAEDADSEEASEAKPEAALADDAEDEDFEDEEPLFFEVTCPSCDETITVDEDVLNLGSIQCPNCGEMMEFEFDEEDEDLEDD